MEINTQADTLILMALLDKLGGEVDLTFDDILEAKKWNLKENRNGQGYRYKVSKPVVLVTPQSSCINGISYEPSSKNLTVEYKSSRGTYIYTDVPEGVVESLRKADSLGSFVARQIKGKFNCFRAVK